MKKRRMPRPTSATEDEFLTPEVGSWAEEKYELFWNYATMFTTAMRQKWDQLVYVDLFAGPGKVKLRGTTRIVPGSPLLALELPVPFDRVVLCDEDTDAIAALRERLERGYPEADSALIPGDANEVVQDILSSLPSFSPQKKVLGLCFVDPYKLRNLRFETIKTLAQSRFLDFLILIPSGMDATRNEGLYLGEEDKTVDFFLGQSDWRQRWEKARSLKESFDTFLTDSFGRSMEALGYRYPGIHYTQLVRLPEKRVRLYRLVLFSRSELGKRFWEAAREYSSDQRTLF